MKQPHHEEHYMTKAATNKRPCCGNREEMGPNFWVELILRNWMTVFEYRSSWGHRTDTCEVFRRWYQFHRRETTVCCSVTRSEETQVYDLRGALRASKQQLLSVRVDNQSLIKVHFNRVMRVSVCKNGNYGIDRWMRWKRKTYKWTIEIPMLTHGHWINIKREKIFVKVFW